MPEDKISDYLEIDEKIFNENNFVEKIYLRQSIYVFTNMNQGIIKRIDNKKFPFI